MNKKLVLKILVLVFIFLLVVMFRQSLGSTSFKDALGTLFGVGKPTNTIKWCVENSVDFLWTNADVPESLKQSDITYLRINYCELATEPISGVDLDKITWEPLAESRGPAGQLSKLEWSKQHEVFRAGGMPFKSSAFAAELKLQ